VLIFSLCQLQTFSAAFLLSALLPSSLQKGIQHRKLPRRPENRGDPGDGRWTGIPQRRPEKRIADQSQRRSRAVGFHTNAGHGDGERQPGAGHLPRPPPQQRSLFLLHLLSLSPGKNTVYAGLLPKSFPVSEIFGHLQSKISWPQQGTFQARPSRKRRRAARSPPGKEPVRRWAWPRIAGEVQPHVRGDGRSPGEGAEDTRVPGICGEGL